MGCVMNGRGGGGYFGVAKDSGDPGRDTGCYSPPTPN